MCAENPVLKLHPNSAFNVFVMASFAQDELHRQIMDAIRYSLGRYGYTVLRADDQASSNELWANVKHYMGASELGIAVFEDSAQPEFNPNVSLELGYMLALQRRVLLLKDRSLPSLPTDMLGNLYKNFDRDRTEATVTAAVHEWLRDIGVAKSRNEKVVVFVSHGGTCRCAMSKVVATKDFRGRSLPFPIRFESMAYAYGNSLTASNGARKAVKDAFGEDLLAHHRVMKKNPGIIEDADLILVMGESLARGLPREKTHLMAEFFLGRRDRIRNPWPDDNAGAAERYKACLDQIRNMIEGNAHKIITALAG